MKLIIIALLAFGSVVTAEHRFKRQFPGPREERAYEYERSRPAKEDPRPPAERSFFQQDDGAYQVPRRQFQAQPVQQYSQSSRSRQPSPPVQRYAAPPAPAPVQRYSPPAPPPPPPAPARYAPDPAPDPAPAPAPRSRPVQYEESPPPRRKPASRQYRKPSGSAPQQQLNDDYPPEEEEEQKPDALTLLLQNSKFTCSSRNDGYYADNSIDCQVFHYCVGGARHSWMCPAGTVFHQVHLNCVPASQDICKQSEKFHFVNDYLYKPIQGPNNTVLYHEKYYPEGYSIGDPLVPPQPRQKQEPRYEVQEQSYGPPPQQQHSQPRPPPRPAAPPPQYKPRPPPPPPPPSPPRSQPSYNQPPPPPPPRHRAPAYSPQSPPRAAPKPRPSRPVYEEPPQSYRSRPSYDDAPPRYRAPPANVPRRPSSQQYSNYENSAGVQYDDEY